MKLAPSRIILAAATVLLASPAISRAEDRVFTSNDGKTLMAELVGATASSATLKLDSGERSTIPLNRLSQADQDYVNKWISAHPAAIRYGFTVDWDKERVNGSGSGAESPGVKKPKVGRSPLVDHTETQMLLHFKITNRAAVPLEGVTVSIKVYEKTQDNHDHYLEYERTIEKMAAGATATVDSDIIDLQRTQFKGGSYTSGGTMYVYVPDGPTHSADSIRGYAVSIKHAGHEVYSTTSSGYRGIVGKN